MPAANVFWTILLLSTFAGLATVHVATVYGLARVCGVGAAALGFFVPPAAPYQAIVHGMKARAILWIVLAVAYIAALIASAR